MKIQEPGLVNFIFRLTVAVPVPLKALQFKTLSGTVAVMSERRAHHQAQDSIVQSYDVIKKVSCFAKIIHI